MNRHRSKDNLGRRIATSHLSCRPSPRMARSRDASANLDQIHQIRKLMQLLQHRDPTGACVVELHYFARFTIQEIAGLTDLTPRQVRHLCERSLNWLKSRSGARPNPADDSDCNG